MPALTADRAARLAAGAGEYLADRPPGPEPPLEVAFVRSPHPHARLGDITGAGATAADLGLKDLVVEGPGLVALPWPALARDAVRYVGEPVAAVWAASRAEAEDAADRVAVDYQPLAAEEPRTIFEHSFAAGEVEAAFAAPARVVERTWRAARQTPLPLECRGVSAAWDGSRLTVWTSTQVPHIVRRGIADALRLEAAAVRVLVPDVGGGFGLKAHVFPEELVIGALARRLERPVRWQEDRRENLIAGAHAHDNSVRLRVAFTAEGRLLGVDAEVIADVGAHSIYPFSASLEPMTTATALFAPYDVAAIRFRARALTSHRCPVGAYRGVGTNTAVYATERMLDTIASELGLDPLLLRRRNLLGGLPRTSIAGRALDSGDYGRLLDRLEASAGYAALRAGQRQARAQGRLLGIGVSLFNEHSGTGRTEYRSRGITTVPGLDATRVRVTPAGRVEVHTSSADAGQGHGETYRLVAAERLGLPAERVDVFEGDTDLCPPGTGAFVSRGAVGLADSLVAALEAAAEQDLQPGTDVTRVVDPVQVFPSGAHLAVVEVDPASLVPRVLAYHAVEDCGRVLHEQVVAGQVRGGVAMGIGKVLMEECVYGDDGQIQTASLLDYLVPLAADVPPVLIEHLGSPSPRTRLGSKGVGEAGTIGAFGAVSNAVQDAIAPLGAELSRLPYSPSRIFEAVEAAAGERGPGGAEKTPPGPGISGGPGPGQLQ